MASLQKRICKGHTYWSIVESKRINGKPRPIVIDYIGNDKKLQARLLNNSPVAIKSYSHGATHALYRMAKVLNIETILDSAFAAHIKNGVKRSTALLIIAINRACNPCSKNALVDWFKGTTLKYEFDNLNEKVLTSDFFWHQMDGITEDELKAVEDTISNNIITRYSLKLDKLALDYTNYFTYISSSNTKCEIAKRGHNKQKRNDLRQISMTVVTSKELGIPLYSDVYEGNKNDQTEFKKYIKDLKKRIPNYDSQDLTIVFDGGSVNKENLAIVDNYITRFSLSRVKELYDFEIDDKVAISTDKEITYKRFMYNIWGKDVTCILTFSEKLYVGEASEIENNISKAIKSIEELKAKLKNKRSRIAKKIDNINNEISVILSSSHIKDIINVSTIENEGTIDIKYNVDEKNKVEILKKYCGKKLIITNRNSWGDAEILKAYYDQDCIENIFKDSKNPDYISITPQYHYTESKIRVHIFCCLLGLTLTSLLNKHMKDSGINVTNSRLIETLNDIRESWVKMPGNNNVQKMLEETTGEQGKMLNIIETI